MKNILIIGGARSGKSRFAQELALKLGEPVLFVATAEAGDEEMKLRKGDISTRQLSGISGVSMRTLDTWVKAGFITTAYVDGEGKGS
ncbi:hypothetical protein LCGC14_3089090, partial [marine sediment metagenome]